MSIGWLKDGSESFCRSLKRNIDEETLADLLEIIEYQSARIGALEEIGITDNGDPTDILFTYVLDAIGAPIEGDEGTASEFRRNHYREMFYGNYLVDRDYNDCRSVLTKLVQTATEESNRLE